MVIGWRTGVLRADVCLLTVNDEKGYDFNEPFFAWPAGPGFPIDSLLFDPFCGEVSGGRASIDAESTF